MLLTKRIHESRVTKVTNTPTAPNYPRHHHPSFAANIRYDFPPPPVSISPTLPLPPFIPLYPYHVAASSTLSLPYLPFSHHARSSLHQLAPPIASLPTHRRARHPSRSREDHRDASLRSCPTYANVVVVAVTITTVALVVVGSSVARINRQESADDRLLRIRRGASVRTSSGGGPVVPLARP